MQLTRGQRARLADLIASGERLNLGVSLDAPGLTIDIACFGLDAAGKLSDERYMTFFNQPATPCGGVRLGAPPGDQAGFMLDLGRLPASIERLTLTAAIDGAGTMSQIAKGHVRLLDAEREVARFAFVGGDFAQERALMLLEIYRKDGVWRLCALGQGFNGGLAALVESFGGTVAPEAPVAPPPKPPAAPVNLSKITLEKRGSSVSLDKAADARHGEMRINLNWKTVQSTRKGFLGGFGGGRTDLDLGCLYELANGDRSAVQALGGTFGDYHRPPYIRLDSDDRTGANVGGENLRINGQHWEQIRRVLVYAYIYEGTPNWAEAEALISLAMPGQPEIEVRLDSHRNDRPMCAIALLENQDGAVKVTKLVDYHQGHRDMDQAHAWGLEWVRGSKG